MSEGGLTSGAAGGGPVWWTYVPPIWLAANILLAGRRLFGSWWLVGETGLPGVVAFFVYGGAVAALVTLLWGLLVLRLAWVRSPRFPKHFIVWQAALILWIAAVQLYVLLTPEFALSPSAMATAALEVAVGIFCIVVASRSKADPQVAVLAQPAAPLSATATVLAGFLGLVAGAVLGFGAGLLGGALFAEATNMSCFEGACGFFAFFIGLAGLVVGAIVGVVLAVVLARRRRVAPAA